MTEIPGMILWTDAYLADTTHLSTFEHGAYLLILMAMWRNGGKLAKDSKKLAMVAKVPPMLWRHVEKNIMDFMTVVEEPDGKLYITQGRLTRELNHALIRHKNREVAGRLGGIAKSLKNKKPHGGNAVANGDLRSSTITTTTTKERVINNGLGQKRGSGNAASSKAGTTRLKAGLNSFFIEEGTPQWSAWEASWRKTHGTGLPKSYGANGKAHWYFPTEWPSKGLT